MKFTIFAAASFGTIVAAYQQQSPVPEKMGPEVSHALSRAVSQWATTQHNLRDLAQRIALHNDHDHANELLQSSINGMNTAVDASNNALWQVSEACCCWCGHDSDGGNSNSNSNNNNYAGYPPAFPPMPPAPAQGLGGGAITEPPSTDSNGNLVPPAKAHRFRAFPILGRLFPMGWRGAMKIVNTVVSYQMKPVLSQIENNVLALADNLSAHPDNKLFQSHAANLVKSMQVLISNTNEFHDLSGRRESLTRAVNKLQKVMA